MEENGRLSVKDKVSFYVQINNFWLKNKKKVWSSIGESWV